MGWKFIYSRFFMELHSKKIYSRVQCPLNFIQLYARVVSLLNKNKHFKDKNIQKGTQRCIGKI